MSFEKYLPEMSAIIRITIEAGREIMRLKSLGLAIGIKKDGSPVTIADQKAEEIIIKGLKALSPNIPIIAEEEVAAGREPDITHSNAEYYLVDALDGTKGFIKGGRDFSVNIALIKERVPILGVIFAPALQELYYGETYTNNAFRCKTIDFNLGPKNYITTRKATTGNYTILASHSHSNEATKKFLTRFPRSEILTQSSSLKFVRLAEGAADIYPRLGPTCEWDIAAGHAILEAAGGIVYDNLGKPFKYKKDSYLNGHFIALGDKTIPVRL